MKTIIGNFEIDWSNVCILLAVVFAATALFHFVFPSIHSAFVGLIVGFFWPTEGGLATIKRISKE